MSSASIAECLVGAGIPRLEAQMLLEAITGMTRAALITHPEQPVSGEHLATFRAWCARRQTGEPIAYLLGRREFYSLEFAVSPDVLIPRPETELLVELALRRINDGARRIVDLGTGSGALAIAIAKNAPAAEVWAVDASVQAIAVARANADRHGVSIRLLTSDWFAALGDERFDLIVANPPYVSCNDPHLGEGDLRFEPRDALVGGADGLDAIRTIVERAPAHLSSGGWIAIEHGYDQGESVATLLVASGFEDVTRHSDLAGIWRVTSGTTGASRPENQRTSPVEPQTAVNLE